ncbi:hypothetical protein B0H11DRAFT_2281153 [Mycena galericulata]|nr:hypothetical protein B0H11DRAFT_2281153 [Mycena galericulata]
MPFPNIEDIIDNIVAQVFLDGRRADGDVYDYESLPKNFLSIGLVSRNFLNPMRRNLYGDLPIEGPERFMLLTGQLRFSPHLSRYVKSATLVSSCSERTHIDGREGGTPRDGEPRIVSSIAFRWFLEACPQLKRLKFTGGDFLWALSVQKPETMKVTEIAMRGCFQCDPESPDRCTGDLDVGWLKTIVAFSRLKELDITELLADGLFDPTAGMEAGSSVCTGLSISNMNKPTSPRVLATLFGSMSALRKLVLDRIQPMAPGELKKCLDVVAPTLTLLTISDYRSQDGRPHLWENDTVADLRELQTLSLNGVPVTAPFFEMLPPRLQHLRFSGVTLAFLPAPALAGWLRGVRFPIGGVLKRLETVGQLRAGTNGGTALDAQVAEIAQLSRGLGIEWIHQPRMFRGDSGYGFVDEGDNSSEDSGEEL